MKIYTRQGDAGTTSLVGGQRISKSDPRLEAYGTLDELNAFLGLTVCAVQKISVQHSTLSRLETTLATIQNDLFTIGSHLACVDDKQRQTLPALPLGTIHLLEQEIDTMTAHIPALKQFILPGGTEASTLFHVSRTVCRRAERATVTLQSNSKVEPEIIQYINRLSDYLFVAARYAQHTLGHPDVPWQK